MSCVARLCFAFSICAAIAQGQIYNLATDATGRDIYFATTLSQRGSGELATSKLFLLRDGALTAIGKASPEGVGGSAFSYTLPAVTASGDVRAVSILYSCAGGSSCFFRELAGTQIQTPSRTFSFDANAALSFNGRFAAVYGNTNSAPNATLAPRSIRLLDLDSGEVTLAGAQGASYGRMVSNDGSVLAARTGGVRLVGPSRQVDLTPTFPMYRAELASDASRVVYDQTTASEIHVIDVQSGIDRSLGAGAMPTLAQDGRTFSFLRAVNGVVQVWLGDALTGSVQALSQEPAGIKDQTITGNGTSVIAVTGLGSLLTINTATGAATQLLGPAGPSAFLATSAVPGSYNELQGTFPEGFVPDLRVGDLQAIVLGRTPLGFAIQIPWEAPLNSTAPVILRAVEPHWEFQIRRGVFATGGGALPVGSAGAGGRIPYAVHQDWSGPVTPEKPASRGEIVHLFATGYGRVDGTVESGKPTPVDRLYRIATPCTWKALGFNTPSRNVEALFAGLAPGLTGIYQVDLRIPTDWPEAVLNAYCEIAQFYFLPTAAIYGIQ